MQLRRTIGAFRLPHSSLQNHVHITIGDPNAIGESLIKKKEHVTRFWTFFFVTKIEVKNLVLFETALLIIPKVQIKAIGKFRLDLIILSKICH
jgi:hypothetical protein